MRGAKVCTDKEGFSHIPRHIGIQYHRAPFIYTMVQLILKTKETRKKTGKRVIKKKSNRNKTVAKGT